MVPYQSQEKVSLKTLRMESGSRL